MRAQLSRVSRWCAQRQANQGGVFASEGRLSAGCSPPNRPRVTTRRRRHQYAQGRRAALQGVAAALCCCLKLRVPGSKRWRHGPKHAGRSPFFRRRLPPASSSSARTRCAVMSRAEKACRAKSPVHMLSGMLTCTLILIGAPDPMRGTQADEVNMQKFQAIRAGAGVQYTVPRGGVVLGSSAPASGTRTSGQGSAGPKFRLTAHRRVDSGEGRAGTGVFKPGPKARVEKAETEEERREKFAAALEKRLSGATTCKG